MCARNLTAPRNSPTIKERGRSDSRSLFSNGGSHRRPRAIYQSLRRRSERLQKRLRELELLQRGATVEAIAAATPALDSDVIRLNNHIGGVPTGFFVPASESDT